MSGKSSNTALNAGKFVKGADPRRNTKGRPKSFDLLRSIALKIADEKVSIACKKLGIAAPTTESERLTVAQFVLRKWAFSNEPTLQKQFMDTAFGKVPDELSLGDDVRSITVTIKHGD